MQEAEFLRDRKADWERLRLLLAAVDSRRSQGQVRAEDWELLPQLFRRACGDLALARQRMYSRKLIGELNDLVIEANRKLHRDNQGFLWRFFRLMGEEVPQAFRREWQLYVFCSLAFWLPFGLMLWAGKTEFIWVESLLGAEQMQQLDSMYGPGQGLAEVEDVKLSERFVMFGFYILNNVGIDFRVFAGGVLAGVGVLIILLFNGVYIGAAASYCTENADFEAFWGFVSGHSAPELVGMLLCGMAGMRVGLAWLRPGRLRRSEALGVAGRASLPLLFGGALMTAFAAVIEAFWSPLPMAFATKVWFGVGMWVMIHVYLLFCGRRRVYES